MKILSFICLLFAMKYSNEITINQPLDKVIALFDNADNLKEWMPNLERFEHLSGEPGQPGAKSKMVFLRGKNKMTMVETITKNNLPEEFSGTYEASGVINIQQNSFHKVTEQSTKWVSQSEFQFASLGMKFMGWVMPGAFKKQSLNFMKNFKAFAEKS